MHLPEHYRGTFSGLFLTEIIGLTVEQVETPRNPPGGQNILSIMRKRWGARRLRSQASSCSPEFNHVTLRRCCHRALAGLVTLPVPSPTRSPQKNW
jgi:hypothetical protein